MLEFDMLIGEFVDEAVAEAEGGQWSPTAELYAELRLLTVDEAEAERIWRR
jgi:hypothetical protein